MTWQEELRKLDEDFSAGNITADQYRVRRDQVLSSAVAPGDQAQQPQGQSNADATQIVSPVQPPAPPEATQVVSPQQFGAPAEPERTQAVRPDWQQQGPPTPMYHPQGGAGSGGFPAQGPGSGGFPAQGPASGGFAAQGPGSGGFAAQQHGGYPQDQGYAQDPGYAQDHGYPQGPGSGGFAAQDAPQQGWGDPQGAPAAPPWGGADYPPPAQSSTDEWGVQQGPESFDEEEKSGKAGKMAGIAVAVIVLAGLAFGGWWLWGRGESEPTGGGDPKQSTTAQPSESAAPSSTAPAQHPTLPIAQLEGTPGETADIKQFADVAGLNYLTPDETSSYQTAGATEANFKSVWMAGGSKAIVLLTKCSGGDAAGKAAPELGKIQTSNGAKKAANQPKGVVVTEYTDKKSGLGQIRAHYASGDVLVRIEVANAKGLEGARKTFKDVLNAQLELLPAGA